MTSDDFASVVLTMELASVSTLILVFGGVPLAWWIARGDSRMHRIVEASVALPLVLPPTVLGFYLLVLLGPDGPLGAAFSRFGFDPPVFSFAGLVIGSCLYSLPFVIQPLVSGFKKIPKNCLEIAASLRASPIDRFFSVVLPWTKASIINAGIMSFAHTLGEFGVVLMLGGNIPGKTRVLSITIYDHVEALEYDQANRLSFGLLVISFMLLFFIHNRSTGRGDRGL